MPQQYRFSSSTIHWTRIIKLLKSVSPNPDTDSIKIDKTRKVLDYYFSKYKLELILIHNQAIILDHTLKNSNLCIAVELIPMIDAHKESKIHKGSYPLLEIIARALQNRDRRLANTGTLIALQNCYLKIKSLQENK